MDGYFTPKEVSENYINACQTKISMSNWVLIGKAIMAGALIALGAAMSSVAAHTIKDVGLARLTAAVVFPVGLMMVVLMGAELFTGDCLVAMSMFDKKQKLLSCVRLLVLVYIGNFIGSVLIAVLVALSGQLDYSAGVLGAYTIKIAVGKVNLTFVKGVASGIICNILVCAAVLMAMCAKDISGKILVCFFVIMLFVTGGFEHCVANMYYIPAGIVAMLNPDYVEAAKVTYGYSQEYLNTLNVANFFVKNLLPVTIGNILGGMFFVGAPMYYLNRGNNKPAKGTNEK